MASAPPADTYKGVRFESIDSHDRPTLRRRRRGFDANLTGADTSDFCDFLSALDSAPAEKTEGAPKTVVRLEERRPGGNQQWHVWGDLLD